MDQEISKIFHFISKKLKLYKSNEDLFGDDLIKNEWLTTYYKRYARFPSIKLSNDHLTSDFFDLIKNRKSERDFRDEAVTLSELGTILKYSCGITFEGNNKMSHRAQPSAGARFPIEIYPLILKSSTDLKAGLYHYNVKDHEIVLLREDIISSLEFKNFFSYEWVSNSGVVLLLTAIFWRTQNKYSERGYRYIFLEAGHIGQNIYLTSEAMGLKCCALVGTRDNALEKYIEIDGITESMVYALAIGK